MLSAASQWLEGGRGERVGGIQTLNSRTANKLLHWKEKWLVLTMKLMHSKRGRRMMLVKMQVIIRKKCLKCLILFFVLTFSSSLLTSLSLQPKSSAMCPPHSDFSASLHLPPARSCLKNPLINTLFALLQNDGKSHLPHCVIFLLYKVSLLEEGKRCRSSWAFNSVFTKTVRLIPLYQ